RGLRAVLSERPMHQGASTDRFEAPLRGGADSDASTLHTGCDAAAPQYRRAPLWHVEVQHIRETPFPAASTMERWNRDGDSCVGLQHETSDEGHGDARTTREAGPWLMG